MHPRRSALATALVLALAVSTVAGAHVVSLFDGSTLAGWEPVAKDGPPPPDTWTVADGVIKCTGSPNGYLRTVARFSNYKLTVQWRWTGPALVDSEGRPRARNSGVLLHMQTPEAIWPRSIEAQLMEGNAGDFYVIGGVETAELVARRDAAVAAAGADEEAIKRARGNRRLPKAQPSSERPIGEWNTYEITCDGDTVSLVVNGVAQNTATRVTVGEGHICLQSEGAAIEFRNISLEHIHRQ